MSMTRLSLLGCGLVLSLLGTGCGPSSCLVTVENQLQYEDPIGALDIAEVHVSASSDTFWGENLLAGVIALGDSQPLEVAPWELVDVRAIDEEGDEYHYYDLDCSAGVVDVQVTPGDLL